MDSFYIKFVKINIFMIVAILSFGYYLNHVSKTRLFNVDKYDINLIKKSALYKAIIQNDVDISESNSEQSQERKKSQVTSEIQSE